MTEEEKREQEIEERNELIDEVCDIIWHGIHERLYWLDDYYTDMIENEIETTRKFLKEGVK